MADKERVGLSLAFAQAISGMYCAVFSTWAYFHPLGASANTQMSSPSQPLTESLHGMPIALLIGILVLAGSVAVPAITSIVRYFRYGSETDLLARTIEEVMTKKLLEKGLSLDSPQSVNPISVPTPSPIADKKFNSEIHLIGTAPKNAFAQQTREVMRMMGKEDEFLLDVDVLVDAYIVNVSGEKQYIRDLGGTVEIEGKKINMVRQRDFYAFDVNGTDYEYCLDPSPEEPAGTLDSRAEALKSLAHSFPVELEPRKPMEGWTRFMIEKIDPEKLNKDTVYEFWVEDSLGDKHSISKPSGKPVGGKIAVYRMRSKR